MQRENSTYPSDLLSLAHWLSSWGTVVWEETGNKETGDMSRVSEREGTGTPIQCSGT